MFASIVAAFTMACCAMGPQPSVEDLDWIAGDRVSRSATSEAHEVWIGPGAGMLLGMSLTKRLDGGRGQFEHMRIATLPDGRRAHRGRGRRPVTGDGVDLYPAPLTCSPHQPLPNSDC